MCAKNDDSLKRFYYKIHKNPEKLQNKYIPRNRNNKPAKATKRLSVRCTEEEYGIIESQSKKAGVSKAAFLKQAALGKEVKNANPEIIIKIVEMEEKIDRLLFDNEETGAKLRNELNELKDEFFDDWEGVLNWQH